MTRRTSPGSACVRQITGALLFLGCLSYQGTLADGSAWLPEPQTGYASLSVIHQSADEFYRGTEKRPTPGSGHDLSQTTVWMNIEYALADSWSVDVQAGWAKSEFVTGPGIPTASESFSGMTDASVGITWRMTDETTGTLPSIAVRVGGIAAGNYRTGQINSLGDGGNGYEASVIAGKFLSANLGVTGDFGYRRRDNDIPAERFMNASGLLLINETVSLGIDYRVVASRSGLDIGAPGFSPARFPELKEDLESLGVARVLHLRRHRLERLPRPCAGRTKHRCVGHFGHHGKPAVRVVLRPPSTDLTRRRTLRGSIRHLGPTRPPRSEPSSTAGLVRRRTSADS